MNRVSIIIPHMNQPDFLKRCLKSIEPQVEALPGTEVIVVDNGSRELPTSIVGAYAWAQLGQESIKGPGPARNQGIAISCGEVLAFIDADCVAHPEWLASIVREFDNKPGLEVIGGDVRIGMVDGKHPTLLEAYESVFAYRQEEYIDKHKFSGTGNLAMRRPVFAKVGPFAGIGIAEDRDWGQRATKAGVSIKYVPGMIVYHPARRTFRELCAKWDRHMAHDFNDKAKGFGGRIRWMILSVAVAASSVVDIRRVLTSDRIEGVWSRILASAVLFRIRLYRATRMLGMVFYRDRAEPKWNG